MSTLADTGIPGVGSGILQPKLKNRWRVTFANFGGGVNSQPISMQATTVSRPKLTFAEVELHRYNSKAWVGGKHDWEACNLTVEDDIASTASTVIQEQLQKQQWLIGAEGQWLAAASEGTLYKFTTYIDMLDGGDQVVEKWILEGCWLSSVDWSDLDYSSSDQITIPLTIRFDHARQNLDNKYSKGPGIATGGKML
jgi:hypothetical protein